MLKIPSRAKFCCKGKEPLTSTYISILEEHSGEWVRQDFCENCFEGEVKPPSWRGVIPQKPAQQPRSFEQQSMDLFLELAESGQKEEELYLLALYLERKKMIVKRGAHLYEAPQIGKVFEIKPLTLRSDVYERIKQLFS